MSSWLPGGAQAWSAKLQDTVSRASVSVQRMAENAELQQLGDKVLASAQTAVQQGEAALNDARKSVVHGASAFGLPGLQMDEPEGVQSAPDLARRFAAEARELGQSGSGETPHTTEILRKWANRLEAEGDAGRVAKKALCASGALTDALATLARSKVGRTTIRNATAANIASADQASQLLRQVLGHASSASPAVLDQLLLLVADATKAVAQSRRLGGASSESETVEQDLRWVLGLFTSACTNSTEIATQEQARRVQSVEAALNSLATTTEARPQAQSVGEVPAAGSAVWAEWPGNGQWYRARVTSAGGQPLEVEWLTAPSDIECGREAEYLMSALGDDTQRSKLVAPAVPVAQDRPQLPVASNLESWQGQLAKVEKFNRSFIDLRSTIEEAGASAKQPSQDEAIAQKALADDAKALAALRLQISQRAGELRKSGVPEPSADLNEGPGGTSSKDGDQSPKKALHARVAELKEKREELLAQLKTVEDELSQASAELGRASGEASGGTERLRLLTQALAVSDEVEALVLARKQQANAAEQANHDLPGRQAALSKACLESEVARRRQLEELVRGLHAALWGPSGEAWAQDPSKAAALRGLIGRTGGIVEHAWRETVQLAAETLGDGGLVGARSEDLSRAAKRYKEMRKELHSNLERLAKLEAQVEARPHGQSPGDASELRAFLKPGPSAPGLLAD